MRADLRHNAVNALPTLQIPSPSLVGQTVTVGRAVLPAQVHSSSAPSQSNSFSGSIERRTFSPFGENIALFCKFAPQYGGATAPETLRLLY